MRLGAGGAVCGALVLALAAPAGAFGLKWNVEGYYRVRTVLLTNLANEDLPSINFDPAGGRTIFFPRIKNTSYIMQRGRLTPSLTLRRDEDDGEPGKVVAALYGEIDIMNDVIWGDNNARSAAPLFAVNPTNTNYLGETVPDVQVPRIWAEFDVKLGKLLVGRMPSHWGMGILANGGGSFNWDRNVAEGEAPRKEPGDHYFDGNDFGDKHFGSTNDRILFATRPIQVVRTMMHAHDPSSNFIMAYAFDKISEAPLLTDEPFERTFRPFGQQGFISRGTKSDDVNEHVIVALYSNPRWHGAESGDELKAGTYIVFRTQEQSCTNPSKTSRDGSHKCDADDGSFVGIYDLYAKLKWGHVYGETEGFLIKGHTFGGVPAPANSRQTANIKGAVARAGWLATLWDGIFEVGYASGDQNLYAIDEPDVFSQRALHPDYNVGLILFEEILRERTQRRLAEGAPGAAKASNPDGAKAFGSLGGVVNAIYLNPRVRWRACSCSKLAGLSGVAGLLMAWNDQTSVLTGQPGNEYFPADGRGRYLGTEVDLGLHYEMYDSHLNFALETGYLRFGSALTPDYDAKGSFTLQSRAAFIF